jgi:hypothetical protein
MRAILSFSLRSILFLLFIITPSAFAINDLVARVPGIYSQAQASLKDGDLFNIIVSGAGKVVPLNNRLIPYSPYTVDTLLNNFSVSTFGDSVSSQLKSNVIYCDNLQKNWQRWFNCCYWTLAL